MDTPSATFGITAARPVAACRATSCRRSRADVVRAILPLAMSAFLAACGGGSSGGGSNTPAPTFTLSGTVSHLEAGGLVISNGSESLTLAAGATSFAFKTPVPNLGGYTVAVATQPAGENCVVNNATGSAVVANVSNVAIVCNTAISSPMTLGVIPVAPSPLGNRIILPVSMVGDNTVSMNAVLDTGSAGTVLNALDVFPSSMVSMNGFVFPAGQTTITYNGITVTNVVATRVYGSQGTIVTTDMGNIGFAQLKMGAGTSVTTKVVPIFFVYQTSVNGQPRASTGLSNLIGVNATASPITVPANPVANGTSAPFCSLSTTSTCRVVSPLRYLTFSGDAAEGFVLSKVTLNDCSSTPVGSCPVQNALTIGLNSAVTTGFATTPLDSCTIVVLPDGRSVKTCSQVIQGVTVSSGGASFTGPAIFDSGEPQIRLDVPQGSNFPPTPSPLPPGTRVSITPPSGATYQYSAGSGIYTTSVVQVAAATDFSNLALEFFTQNSFLLNYAAAVQGWK